MILVKHHIYDQRGNNNQYVWYVSSRRHCFEQDGKTYCEVRVYEPKPYPIIKRGEEPELGVWIVVLFVGILVMAIVSGILSFYFGSGKETK